MPTLVRESNGEVLAGEVTLADNFFLRLKGLLGKSKLTDSQALVIDNCKMVHTFFMKFPLDLIFCDKNFKVISIQQSLKPWKISTFEKNAHYVIELAENTVGKFNLVKNEALHLK